MTAVTLLTTGFGVAPQFNAGHETPAALDLFHSGDDFSIRAIPESQHNIFFINALREGHWTDAIRFFQDLRGARRTPARDIYSALMEGLQATPNTHDLARLCVLIRDNLGRYVRAHSEVDSASEQILRDRFHIIIPPTPTQNIEQAIADCHWKEAYHRIRDPNTTAFHFDVICITEALIKGFQFASMHTADQRAWLAPLAASLLVTLATTSESIERNRLQNMLVLALTDGIWMAASRIPERELMLCIQTIQRMGTDISEASSAVLFARLVFWARFTDVPMPAYTDDISPPMTTRSLRELVASTMALEKSAELVRRTQWRRSGEVVMHRNAALIGPQVFPSGACTSCTESADVLFRAARCTNKNIAFCMGCFSEGVRGSEDLAATAECPCQLCKQPLTFRDFLLAGAHPKDAQTESLRILRRLASQDPAWVNCNDPKCSGGSMRETDQRWNILNPEGALKSPCCLCLGPCGATQIAPLSVTYVKTMLLSLGPWTPWFGTFRNIFNGLWVVPGSTGAGGIREAYHHLLGGIATAKGDRCEHLDVTLKERSASWYWVSGAVSRPLLYKDGNTNQELVPFLDDNCQLFLPEHSPIIAPLGGHQVIMADGKRIPLYNPDTFEIDAQIYRIHALNFLLRPERVTAIPYWLQAALESQQAKASSTRTSLITFLETQVPNARQWYQWRPVHTFLLVFESNIVRNTYERRSELLANYKQFLTQRS